MRFLLITNDVGSGFIGGVFPQHCESDFFALPWRKPHPFFSNLRREIEIKVICDLRRLAGGMYDGS
jgi:hypothetical protein